MRFYIDKNFKEFIMNLEILKYDFAVCKLTNMDSIDYSGDFVFFSKTDDEISVVCPSDNIPGECDAIEFGWKAMRIKDVLDFSLIGIVSKISTILADNSIGIFVISTYNTDYVLVKKESLEKAQMKLEQSGYHFV